MAACASRPARAARLELDVAIEPFSLGGERYPVQPDPVPVRLDISRTTGRRIRAAAALRGDAGRPVHALPGAGRPSFAVDAREVSQRSIRAPTPQAAAAAKQPDEDDELSSPYVEDGVLDLHAWARDALALSRARRTCSAARTAPGCARCAAPT